MSRTHHHRAQKSQHCGHEYGARYNCNKTYGTHYGPDGRNRAHREMRADSKRIVRDISD